MSNKLDFSNVAKVAAVAFAAILSVAGARTAEAHIIARGDAYAHGAPAGSASSNSPDRERMRWDESGTIGRMDLGADPRHPEGPGAFAH